MFLRAEWDMEGVQTVGRARPVIQTDSGWISSGSQVDVMDTALVISAYQSWQSTRELQSLSRPNNGSDTFYVPHIFLWTQILPTGNILHFQIDEYLLVLQAYE